MINLEILKRNIKFSAILTTGRTGSDYLHACLDDVPGLVTFSGSFSFYEFIDKLERKLESYEPNKILDLFIKNNRYLFFQDKIENKRINLDLKKFKKFFNKIIKKNKFNENNFLLTLYISYYLTLDKNISKIKTIVHHSHNVEETKRFIKNFTKVRLLITIRDPRANLMSGIVNWIRYDPSKENEQHFLFYIKRIRQDLIYGLSTKKKLFIKLEEANSKKVKKNILKFLNVDYHRNIEKSTFLGNEWNGDRLSKFKSNKGRYNSYVKKKKWKFFFSDHDKKILDFIYNIYIIFNYDIKKINYKSLIYFFLLTPIPLSFEKDLFKFKYFLKPKIKIKYKLFNFYFYLKRILFCYYVIIDSLFNKK